jgi:MSHA pilin protein MshD
MSTERHQRGFTLIEMIIAIVVLGVGLAGVLAAYMNSVRGSADALVTKQLVAVAEMMMEEILLKPYAPPPGSTVPGATGALIACGGPGSAADRSGYDEVSDYNGYRTSSACGADGAPVTGLEGYAVSVVVSTVNFSGVVNALQVQVTVARAGQSMVLDGIRTNYAGLP